MKEQNKKIVIFVLLVTFVMLIRLFLINDLLSLENLKKERDHFRLLVQDHYVPSVLTFVAIYIVVAALSLPGAAVLTIAGGLLYGTLLTTLYVNVGATTGATLAFLVARHLLGTWLHEKYSSQLSSFNEEMKKNGARYLLTVRLLPAFPFFLINILAGFTNVRLITFIWTTALGILPGTAAYAYAGEQAGTITSTSDVFSARIVIAFTLLAVLAVFPVLYGRFRTPGRRN